MTLRFRNESNQRLTKALFYEQSWINSSDYIYTLKDKDYEVDGKVLPSLYLLYMEECIKDPSEYSFASKHFDGWEHWLMVRDATWFYKPYYQKWKSELEVRIRSLALISLIKESKVQSKNSMAINRLLLEGQWDPSQTKTKRGRPTKDEIEKVARETVENQQIINTDMEVLRTIN